MASLPEPHQFWDAHCAEQEHQAKKLPRCCACKDPIYDEYLWEIDGDIYCEDCATEHFRKDTDRFIDTDY